MSFALWRMSFMREIAVFHSSFQSCPVPTDIDLLLTSGSNMALISAQGFGALFRLSIGAQQGLLLNGKAKALCILDKDIGQGDLFAVCRRQEAHLR